MYFSFEQQWGFKKTQYVWVPIILNNSYQYVWQMKYLMIKKPRKQETCLQTIQAFNLQERFNR